MNGQMDGYRSLIKIKAGVVKASKKQNNYFMGESEGHEVNQLESNVDWNVRHETRVNERFRKNMPYIFDQTSERSDPSHPEHIKLDKDGIPIYSDDIFKRLIWEDHSEYRSQRLQPLAA